MMLHESSSIKHVIIHNHQRLIILLRILHNVFYLIKLHVNVLNITYHLFLFKLQSKYNNNQPNKNHKQQSYPAPIMPYICFVLIMISRFNSLVNDGICIFLIYQKGLMKSSLVLKQNYVEQSGSGKNYVPDIEYKQINNHNDMIGELSDEQKQAQFNKQHEEYIKMKVNRKKELLKLKKEEFGPSSSQSEESSDEEIVQMNVKRSRGKGSNKEIKDIKSNKSILKQQETSSNYQIVLALKKTSIQTQLVFHEKDFQINKKVIEYIKISKIGILDEEFSLKIILFMVGQELSFNINDKVHQRTQIFKIFIQFVKFRMNFIKEKVLKDTIRSNLQEFSEQNRENALIFDKIFKKSQYIGIWEERYIIVKPSGLFSYRSLKGKPTMFISLEQIKELQTSFELYKETLVVKLLYGSTKTDFGLPLDYQLQWLYHFLTMIPKKSQ